MAVAGIIAEYNPFHRGHAWQIAEIRRRLGEYRAHQAQGDGAGFGRLPDLILLDGGKGHVAAVQPVLEEMGVNVPLYGLVKDDKHRTRAIARTGGEIAITSTRRAFTLLSSLIYSVIFYFLTWYVMDRRLNLD